MSWKSYQKYFKGKKILITGNSGFVGSYVSLTLSLLGSKILGYSLKKKTINICPIFLNIEEE